jgi:hypothetical protein
LQEGSSAQGQEKGRNILAENLQNSRRHMNIQIQESQPSSSKINKENYTELYYNQIVETKTSKS